MTIRSQPWKDDPLQYLLFARYPLATIAGLQSPSLNNRKAFALDEALLKEAADYRAELMRLSNAELLERAEAIAKEQAEIAIAKAKAEESARIFNQPSADVDVEHWARMSLWTLDEAAALSLGKDPRRVSWENVRSLVQVSPFAAGYMARHEILTRAKLAGQLWDSTIPGVFIAWAERMRVSVHAPLVDAIRDLGVQVADWKSAYDVQRKIAEDATAELLAEKEAGIRKTNEHTAYLKKFANDYNELINGYRAKVAALEDAARQQVVSASEAPERWPLRQKSLSVRGSEKACLNS